MLKKSFAFLALIISVCILFSSCNIKILSTDELIRPPKLSGENSFLQKAFEETIKSDTVQMKSPINGDNRSSYIISDIDADGTDEALVFFSDYSIDNFAHVAVFKNVGRTWKNITVLTGLAEEIYEVSFNDVNGDGQNEVLISWSSLSPDSSSNETLTLVGNRILTLYTFSGNGITLQKTEHFTGMYVADFNGDGVDDIFLSTVNISFDSNKTTGRIISFNEKCAVEYDKSFSLIGMLDVLSITTDTYKNGKDLFTRIYVDGVLSDAAYVTDIIVFAKDGSLEFPVHSDEEKTPSTARTNKIFSCDINSDGIIEVPTLQELPFGKRINSEGEDPTPLNLVVWSNLVNDGLQVTFKCLYNKAQNYYFIYNEDWIGNITAIYNSNNALLTFYSLDEDGNTKDKLFSIKSFSHNEWDKNNYDFNMLYEADAFVYGYTLDSSDNITKQDVQNSFVAFV